MKNRLIRMVIGAFCSAALIPSAVSFADPQWAPSENGSYMPQITIAEAEQQIAAEENEKRSVRTRAFIPESPLSAPDKPSARIASEELYNQIREFLAANPGWMSETAYQAFEAYRKELGMGELTRDEKKVWELIIFNAKKGTANDPNQNTPPFRVVGLTASQLRQFADYLAGRGITDAADYFKEQYENAKAMAAEQHLLGELASFEKKEKAFLQASYRQDASFGEPQVQDMYLNATRIASPDQNAHPMLKLFFYNSDGQDPQSVPYRVREKVRRWIKLKADSARSFNQELGGHPTVQLFKKLIYGDQHPAVSSPYRDTQISQQRHAWKL